MTTAYVIGFVLIAVLGAAVLYGVRRLLARAIGETVGAYERDVATRPPTVHAVSAERRLAAIVDVLHDVSEHEHADWLEEYARARGDWDDEPADGRMPSAGPTAGDVQSRQGAAQRLKR